MVVSEWVTEEPSCESIKMKIHSTTELKYIVVNFLFLIFQYIHIIDTHTYYGHAMTQHGVYYVGGTGG
jgi:hypothetical protein